MKITVFGANGKVGIIVVKKLLENGHSVKAFVYGSSTLEKTTRLQIISGNVEDKVAVFSAISGSDIIISTLGSWGTKNKNVLSVGMSNILPAAKKYGVTRIISLTGADAIAPGERINLLRALTRLMIKTIAPKILQDAENHMILLKNSSVDWTVVRAPVMSNSGRQNRYTLSRKPPKPWQPVLREDVASAIVGLVEVNEWTKQAPFIRRLYSDR